MVRPHSCLGYRLLHRQDWRGFEKAIDVWSADYHGYVLRVESGAINKEPHQLAQYLRDLANDFHTYYNAHQFLVDDAALRDARIKLILAVQQTLKKV